MTDKKKKITNVEKPKGEKPATESVSETRTLMPKDKYQEGYEDGYRKGSEKGAKSATHRFVASVEEKLAEHDGYKDLDKWRKERTIPSWWIAVLMMNYETAKGDEDYA